MKKYRHLHVIFIKQYLKRLLEYKADFLVGVIGVFLNQGFTILFLSVIFSHIPKLEGYDFSQIAFIYGFSLLPKGIDHLFFDNLWTMGQRLVKRGEFDKYLTRPINPLFHVMVETIQLDALGEILVALLLLATTASAIEWTPGKVAIFVLILPFTTLIYTSIKIATASISFWTRQSGALTYIFYMMNDFAKYPVSIYNPFIRGVISYLIPFAFTAFYPASYFLTGQDIWFNIGGVVLVSSLLFSLAIFIWEKGLLAYESAGS